MCTCASVLPGFCKDSHSSYLPSTTLSLVVPSAKYQVLERVIVKVTWFESPVEVCTCTAPVAALVGTMACMEVSLQETISAALPLMVTVLAAPPDPCVTPKSWPSMVIMAPYGAEEGTTWSIEGGMDVTYTCPPLALQVSAKRLPL